PRAALAAAFTLDADCADVLAAVDEVDAVDLALALDLDLDAGGQRIGDRHADAVQAAREGVGAVALALVELAAGVQPRIGQHHHRHACLGVQADRNAAAVVGYGDRAVQVQRDVNLLCEAARRFVGGVVDDFLDDVGGRVGAGVHARAFAYRLQSLE